MIYQKDPLPVSVAIIPETPYSISILLVGQSLRSVMPADWISNFLSIL